MPLINNTELIPTAAKLPIPVDGSKYFIITAPAISPTIPTTCSSQVSPLAVSTITPPAVDCIKIRPLALLMFFNGETDVAISPATVSKFLAASRLFKNLSLSLIFTPSQM